MAKAMVGTGSRNTRATEIAAAIERENREGRRSRWRRLKPALGTWTPLIAARP